jgi:hypothetical protein
MVAGNRVCAMVLLSAGLALSLGLAGAGSLDKLATARQYETLVQCKALYGLATNSGDKRSKKAAANVDAELKKLAHGKSTAEVQTDVAAKRAKLAEDRYADSSWKYCMTTWASRGPKIDRALSDKLSQSAPQADRLAAAKTIAEAPEKHSSLLLMMAGEPLMVAGQAEEGRFVFHAGVLRTSNFMQFIDQRLDQDVVQVFAITRRYFGVRFAIDALTEAHKARLAVERAVTWDSTTPNPELTALLEDSEVDPAEVRNKVEAQRCNYLASFYFGEATAELEIKERYDGDAAKFRRALATDVARQSIPAGDLKDWKRRQEEGALGRFSARQTEMIADAKEAIADAHFDGDEDAYEEKKKADPAGVCALLLTEAKKPVH